MDVQKILTVSLASVALLFFGYATTAFSLETTTTDDQAQHAAIPPDHIPTPEEDKIITKSLRSEIAKSKLLSRFDIDVETHEGIVTLKGNVNANSEASRLIELAQSIIGVRDVESDLTVARSNHLLSDTLITAKVKGLFIREGIFGPKRPLFFLNVETRNGVVYLTGNIVDKQKIDRAIALVKRVRGVSSVEYKFTKLTPHNKD